MALKKFTFNPKLVLMYFPNLDDYIKESILKNNTTFTVWKDGRTLFPVVECENKPQNLYASGVIWEEMKDS